MVFFLLTSLFSPHITLFAATPQEQQQMQEKEWVGPGYYYGVWFNTEEDYLRWRAQHPEYPPSRTYYNADHPIPYEPNQRIPDQHIPEQRTIEEENLDHRAPPPAAIPRDDHVNPHPEAHPATRR